MSNYLAYPIVHSNYQSSAVLNILNFDEFFQRFFQMKISISYFTWHADNALEI